MQTISVATATPDNAAFGSSFDVAATASSGLPVTIAASGACNGGGTDAATITMTSASGTCTVTYSQSGNAFYTPASTLTSSTTATKATPSVTAWPTASAITYGQPLSSSTLTDGTASVTGSFAFTTPAYVPPAGPYSAAVTFTPTDAVNYNTVTGSVDVTVNSLDSYSLTYLAGTGGSISGTTPQTVNYGQSGTAVTAVANAGYSFVQWSDGNPSATRTDSNVMANLTVTAQFAIIYDIYPGSTVTFTRSNVGLTFSSVNTAGNVITQPLSGLTPPTGYSIPAGVSYEISTDASYGGVVTVCLGYSDGISSNESGLKLFHRVGTTWINITESVDTANNKVCGTTSSLSPFTIAAPVSTTGTPVPVMNGWWLLPAALGGMGLLFRRRRP